MPRGIQFFGKKRGDRRTGSARAGVWSEAIFYGAFLILGMFALLYLLLFSDALGIFSNKHLVETKCRIEKKQLGELPQLGITRYRPEFTIRYEVNGESLSTSDGTYDAGNEYRFEKPDAEAILEDFEVGQNYPCWYDRRDPSKVFLIRYQAWTWVLLIAAGSFVVFGGAGLAYSLMHSQTSVERQLSRSSQQTSPFGGLKKAISPLYPAIPAFEHITDSPGTALAFRLPMSSDAGWKFLGLSVTTILWNLLVWLIFLFEVVRGFVNHQPNWLLSIFLLPFVACGIWLLVIWIRQILIAAGIGGTRIEIESHPLYPGETYRICIGQSGRMKVNKLSVLFVCEERATYQQGTDTRSETLRVHEETIYEKESITVTPAAEFQDEFTLSVPVSIMHSFAGQHNEIAWSVIVRGDVERWPDFERRFSVCIVPGKHESTVSKLFDSPTS